MATRLQERASRLTAPALCAVIFTNAMTYNTIEQSQHRNAVNLSNFFEELWRDEKTGNRRRSAPAKYSVYVSSNTDDIDEPPSP